MAKQYDPEFKKLIVEQVNLKNGDYCSVAEKNNLPKSTVHGWVFPPVRKKARSAQSVQPKMNIDLAVELCLAYKNNGISRELLKAMLPKALGI